MWGKILQQYWITVPYKEFIGVFMSHL